VCEVARLTTEGTKKEKKYHTDRLYSERKKYIYKETTDFNDMNKLWTLIKIISQKHSLKKY
jgi:hypothetical protein